jgi:hypothetical protein
LCQYRLQTFELLRVVIRPEMYEEETRFAVEHVVVDRATSIPWSRSTLSTGFTSLAIRTNSPVIAALPAGGRLKISSVRQTHYRRDIHPAILDRFRAADTEPGRRGGFLRRHGDGWNTQMAAGSFHPARTATKSRSSSGTKSDVRAPDAVGTCARRR